MEEARRDAGLSDSNLDVIHAVNDAVGQGEPATIAGHMHPDVVWEHNLGTGSPEEGVYEGRETVIRLFERITETWEYMRLEPHSIEPLGEGRDEDRPGIAPVTIGTTHG